MARVRQAERDESLRGGGRTGKMAAEGSTSFVWQRELRRPLQLLSIVLAVTCVLAILGVGLLAQRGRARLRRVRARVEHNQHLLEVGLRAQQSLLETHRLNQEVDPAVVAELRGEVGALAASGLMDSENAARLRRLSEILDSSRGPLDRDRLTQTVAVLRRVLESETRVQSELWQGIDADASTELDLVLGVALLLPLLAVGIYAVARWRIFKPLADLRRLLVQLASGEGRQVDPEGAHPVLIPLFENYNRLVVRLAELEDEHRSHARELEERIRDAARALLEQQATLARAERLAAVGETAAGLAHELKNPLAGIHMALGNLRAEACDSDSAERLGLVIEEIDRLTRLLNEFLSAARHRVEQARELRLGGLVDEVLALLRYQLPAHIELANAVPRDLLCILPADRVRQVVLNLVLNSAHALGERRGTVTVAASRRDEQLRLVVEDDGPGFPQQLLDTGIRAFGARTTGGTGLGLAVVQRLARDLGGRVTLENLEPLGARVRLELPCGHG